MNTKYQVYSTITLLSGTFCTIIVPNGHNLSRASKKAQNNTEFDAVPFYMEEMCRIDGKTKPFEYYLELMGDDYLKIMEVLAFVITRIK